MSNTATELFQNESRIYGLGPVRTVQITFDTVDEDLVVHSPIAGNSAFLTKLVFSEADAANLTIKSGSDSLVVLQLAANQGVWTPQDGIPIHTEYGEDLIMQCSVAIATMVAYIVEGRKMEIK